MPKFTCYLFKDLVMQTLFVCPQAIVIQPKGSLDATNAADFQYQLKQAVLSQDNSGLLVDMGKVESIDSAGLMVLVSALGMANSLNKQFSLCAVSESVRMIFELTQLDRVFEILDCHTLLDAA
jgi:anti-anti-sigma factor